MQTCTVVDYMNVQLVNAVWLNSQLTTSSAITLSTVLHAESVALPSWTWRLGVVVPDSARICRIWKRGRVFSIVTNIVSVINTSSIPIWLLIAIFKYKCIRFVESRLGYVTNATSEQIKAATALARACEVCVLPILGLAESGPTTPGVADERHPAHKLPYFPDLWILMSPACKHFRTNGYIDRYRRSLTTYSLKRTNLPIHGIYFLLSHFLPLAVTKNVCPISAQQ